MAPGGWPTLTSLRYEPDTEVRTAESTLYIHFRTPMSPLPLHQEGGRRRGYPPAGGAGGISHPPSPVRPWT